MGTFTNGTPDVSRRAAGIVSGGANARGDSFRVMQITGSSSYATGGDTIDLSAFGRITAVVPITDMMNAATHYPVQIIPPTKIGDRESGYPAAGWKVKVNSAIATEVTNTTSLATYSMYILVIGSLLTTDK